jgi:hypothetical protein
MDPKETEPFVVGKRTCDWLDRSQDWYAAHPVTLDYSGVREPRLLIDSGITAKKGGFFEPGSVSVLDPFIWCREFYLGHRLSEIVGEMLRLGLLVNETGSRVGLDRHMIHEQIVSWLMDTSQGGVCNDYETYFR